MTTEKLSEIWQKVDKIGGWFSKQDVELVSKLPIDKKATILELGTHRGRSTLAFRLLFPNATIYTCDPLITPDRVILCDKKVIFLNKTGHVLDWGKKIDLLFIDDDHLYKTTKMDINKYKKFIKPNGYILFHDFLSTDVGKAVKDCGLDVTVEKTGEYSMAIWRKDKMAVKKEIKQEKPTKVGKCANCLYEGPKGEYGCPACNSDNWWNE